MEIHLLGWLLSVAFYMLSNLQKVRISIVLKNNNYFLCNKTLILTHLGMSYSGAQYMTGPERVQAAQKYITGLEARRLSKLPENRCSTSRYK